MAVGDFTDIREGPTGVPSQPSRGYTTLDIEGAQADTWRRIAVRSGAEASRSLCTSDISGAQCSALIPRKPNRRSDFSLNCKDVSGAWPARRIRSCRRTDPNVRDYDFPKDVSVLVTPTKQLREVPFCGDITTYATQTRMKSDSAKNRYLDYSDVEGSKPREKRHIRPVTECSEAAPPRVGKVPSNPLCPVYIYDVPKDVKERGQEACVEWAQSCGTDPSMRPRKSKGLRKQQPMLSLSLQGIERSSPADPFLPFRFPEKRREQRKTNDVSDIPGTTRTCKVGTMRTSHQVPGATNRVTNPCNPHYTLTYKTHKPITVQEKREVQALLDDITAVRALPSS